MLFPKYWMGGIAEDKNSGVEFSLKDKSGKYVPIFRIQSYSDADYAKMVASQPDSTHTPYFIAYGNGVNFAYFILAGDDKHSDFNVPFSSGDYKGFSYDLENNITPTFKFVAKGQGPSLQKNFQKSSEFRLMDIKVGDKVGDMTVASIAPFDGAAGTDPTAMHVSNISIKFSGETTLTGVYEYQALNPATNSGELVCFSDLDEASQNKIPNILWSDRPNRFCFSNQDLAKENFQPSGSSGDATIVIDDYTVNKTPQQVVDVARLVRVVEKKQS